MNVYALGKRRQTCRTTVGSWSKMMNRSQNSVEYRKAVLDLKDNLDSSCLDAITHHEQEKIPVNTKRKSATKKDWT